jgi:hypothetical protein
MLGTGLSRHCGLILAQVRDFSVLQSVHTVSGAHIAFIQCVKKAVFIGVKCLIGEGDHSPPSCVEVKVRGAVTPLPTCFYGVHMDRFTFIFGLMFVVSVFRKGI